MGEVVAAVIGLFVILVLVVASTKAWRIKRRMRTLPRTRIADVREGSLVKIVGRLACLGTPLVAPLSQRPCAYFEVKVEEDDGDGGWRSILQESAGHELLLRDSSGKARVGLAGAAIVLTIDYKESSGLFQVATPALEAFLAERGRSSQGWIFNKKLRYQEGVLEESELVAVVGVAHWDIDRSPDKAWETGGGYRDPPRCLVLRGTEVCDLLVTDAPEVTQTVPGRI